MGSNDTYLFPLMQTNYRGLVGPQTKRLQIVPAAPIIPLLNERFDLS